MTVQELVNAALRRINVLAAGEVPAFSDSDDALTTLNSLIDQWKAERLAIYTVTNTTWAIVNGTQTYTLGTAGTIAVARPVFVDHVNFIDTSTDPDTEYQMGSLTDDAWAALPLKALTSTYPTSYYYNPTFPNGTLKLWPIPTSTTLTGSLYAPAAVAELVLTDTLSLPPGYRRMLLTNLALELGPDYGVQPNPQLDEAASDSKAAVKRANKRLADLSCDPGSLLQSTDARYGWSIYVGP